ncbi:hypothetical protein QGN32_20565 [Mycolicibacterium sp. ND9-15]|uniref:hypothetical protein n=1 Tax=Mycolicibacterium sp. ND9-15 TaxID=3042320 RepID=UPI002DD814B6|nr:hypothetical protein [Mycolicibacterium sp. ND9-15]WSE55761.1 hypothetical protein QGN32_20565 [Mycolicibacterium sp. ND9-15]
MSEQNDDLHAEVQGYPVAAAAWQMIAHACALTDDREAAIDAMAADVRSLEASGDIGQAAVVLALVAANAMGNDEIAAKHIAATADARGEFAGIVAACLRQLSNETGDSDDIR